MPLFPLLVTIENCIHRSVSCNNVIPNRLLRQFIFIITLGVRSTILVTKILIVLAFIYFCGRIVLLAVSVISVISITTVYIKQMAPAWSGFCSAGNINKLDRFLNRCKSLNYCSQTTSHIAGLFGVADQSFLNRFI